jgi:hypothetical protein
MTGSSISNSEKESPLNVLTSESWAQPPIGFYLPQPGGQSCQWELIVGMTACSSPSATTLVASSLAKRDQEGDVLERELESWNEATDQDFLGFERSL